MALKSVKDDAPATEYVVNAVGKRYSAALGGMMASPAMWTADGVWGKAAARCDGNMAAIEAWGETVTATIETQEAADAFLADKAYPFLDKVVYHIKARGLIEQEIANAAIIENEAAVCYNVSDGGKVLARVILSKKTGMAKFLSSAMQMDYPRVNQNTAKAIGVLARKAARKPKEK
jgi:hypothetical protein